MIPAKEFDNIPTPFYYYDLSLLDQTLQAVKKYSDYPGFKVHYAVKANANPVILEKIKDYGIGADTVSGGEIARALECGFKPESIVYAGVGKSDSEIEFALKNDIGCLNVESAEELEVISEIASRLGVTCRVALRVNPDIDAHTHHYITTGIAENKFGIAMEMLDDIVVKCRDDKHIEFMGLHFHIGSQITSMEPYVELCRRINKLVDEVENLGVTVRTINVGGGLGIDYDNPDLNPIPDFKSYFETFHSNLNLREDQELHFELGRSIVAQCGSLITRVLYVKKGVGKKFVIVDAGMTDLIRPALYQAHHAIENLSSTSTETERYDVVGPICESSDTFEENESLPVTHRGDLIALRSAGAYGEIMASQYNCRKLPASHF